MKLICAFLAVFICIFPKAAEPAGLYWGANLLASNFQLKNLKVDITNLPFYQPQKVALKSSKTSRAFGVSVFYGIDFNWAGNIPVRAELETTLLQGGSINATGQYPVQGPVNSITVNAEVDVPMVLTQNLNIWLEPPKDFLPFRPYIGATIGLSYMPAKANLTFNRGLPLSSADYSESQQFVRLQYGLGCGVAFPVGKRTFIDLSLRYLKSDRTSSIVLAPATLKFESESLNLNLGFRYYF